MFERTIGDYLTLSVTDCKRMGYFKPNAAVSGVVRWTRNDAVFASVGFATDTRGVPLAKLAYTYNGHDVEATVALRWKRSNLNPASEHGYYYFVCPVTGSLCRKLYLCDGRFVGRQALNALYETQTKSRAWRPGGENGAYLALVEFDRLSAQRYRRETYRGNPTPYGRKIAKLARRMGYDLDALRG